MPDILYTRVSVSVGPRPSRGPYGLPIQAPPVYPLKKSRLTHMAPQMERMRMTCIFQRVAPWKYTLKARVARHHTLSQDKPPITSIFPAPSSSSGLCNPTIAAIEKANIETNIASQSSQKGASKTVDVSLITISLSVQSQLGYSTYLLWRGFSTESPDKSHEWNRGFI